MAPLGKPNGSSAPTGRNAIAPGNALGQPRASLKALKGRNGRGRTHCALSGLEQETLQTQSVALGYRMAPLLGLTKASLFVVVFVGPPC